MHFIPESKNDLDSVGELAEISDDTVHPHLNELFEWIKDINWPVAVPICERLAKFDDRIIPKIDEILSGNDEQWKYTVLSVLIPKLHPAIMELAMTQVVRIINKPTESELREEINLVARDTMFVYSHSV